MERGKVQFYPLENKWGGESLAMLKGGGGGGGLTKR